MKNSKPTFDSVKRKTPQGYPMRRLNLLKVIFINTLRSFKNMEIITMNLNHKYFNQYEIFFKLFLIEIALQTTVNFGIMTRNQKK